MTLIENLRHIRAIVLPDAALSRAADDAIVAIAERSAAFEEIKRLGDALSTARQERDAARGAVTAEVTTARRERDEARRERDEQRTRAEFHIGANKALIDANGIHRDALIEARKARDDWRAGFDAAQADYVKASGERDMIRRQRDDLLATERNLQTELRRVRAERDAARERTWAPLFDVARPTAPSPLNLVERVLRLEREVLFVRQRPNHPPRRP